MTEEQIKALTAGDTTTWGFFVLLLHFLERQGSVDRSAFIEFSRASISQWEKASTELDANTMRIFRSKLEALALLPTNPVLMQ